MNNNISPLQKRRMLKNINDVSMKYHLFAGEIYYAKGGSHDHIETSHDLQSLIDKGEEMINHNKNIFNYEWYHIVDDNMDIVHQSKEQAHNAI